MILHGLIKAMMEMDMPEKNITVEVSELSENEEQALRYCVDYVPVKLQRRYHKMKSNETKSVFRISERLVYG